MTYKWWNVIQFFLVARERRIIITALLYKDAFDFDIIIVPFLDGDVPRSTSNVVHISQLIRFARVSSHVADFNVHNKKFNFQTSPTGLSVSQISKDFLQILSPTQWIGF